MGVDIGALSSPAAVTCGDAYATHPRMAVTGPGQDTGYLHTGGTRGAVLFEGLAPRVTHTCLAMRRIWLWKVPAGQLAEFVGVGLEFALGGLAEVGELVPRRTRPE